MESLKNKNTEFKIKIQKRNLESYFFIFLSSKLLSLSFFLSMIIIPDQIKQSRKLKYRRHLRVQLLRKYPTLTSKCALRLRRMNPAVVLLRRKLNSLKRDCFNIRAWSQSWELLFWISRNPDSLISISTFNLRVKGNYKNYTFPYLYFSYSYPSKSSFQPIT